MSTSLAYDQHVLANEGLFNLKPGEVVQGLYKKITITFKGYNLLEMLGLSQGGNSDDIVWDLGIGVGQTYPIKAIKRYFCPVIK